MIGMKSLPVHESRKNVWTQEAVSFIALTLKVILVNAAQTSLLSAGPQRKP